MSAASAPFDNPAPSVVGRVMEVLTFVADAGRPVGLPEIGEGVRIPRPTVHRICRTLESMGLLARDLNKKRVTVGPKLVGLSLATLAVTSEHSARRAILKAVVTEVEETCTLTVLDHDEVYFLDRVESDSPLRLKLYAGSRVPLHCTSSGKLFLAMMTAARRRKYLGSHELRRYTEATITDPTNLEQELESIRRQRLGRDNQEFVQGLVALAAPVVDSRGRVVAAVSVNGPAVRIQLDRPERYARALRRATTRILSLLEDDEISSNETQTLAEQ